MKNKKGFTLIELLVVITILGMLVLLAGPKLLGYIQKAEVANITHDVKVSEDALMVYLLEENNKIEDFDSAETPENSEVYDKKGVYTESIGGNLYDVTGNIKSNLEGSFLANESGKVYYVKEGIESNWHYYVEDELYKGAERNIGAGRISPDNTYFYRGYNGIDGVEGNTGIALVINANAPDTDNITGMAGTKAMESFGAYEARIKVPEQQGLLNGFFMYGEDSAGNVFEMDMEILKTGGKWELWMTVHNASSDDYVYGKYLEDYDPNIVYSEDGDNYAEPGVTYQKKVNLADLGIDPTSGYVNYKIDFKSNDVKFFVNNNQVGVAPTNFTHNQFEIIASTFWVQWLKRQADPSDGEWQEEMNVEWIRKAI